MVAQSAFVHITTPEPTHAPNVGKSHSGQGARRRSQTLPNPTIPSACECNPRTRNANGTPSIDPFQVTMSRIRASGRIDRTDSALSIALIKSRTRTFSGDDGSELPPTRSPPAPEPLALKDSNARRYSGSSDQHFSMSSMQRGHSPGRTTTAGPVDVRATQYFPDWQWLSILHLFLAFPIGALGCQSACAATECARCMRDSFGVISAYLV
ncbi:Uncharacterised protein [Mycobacteroides abscessus]|nr:Uncharacterised protein [Mycobacteroides abscessus]CPS05371.1 Uncharacterised protein [Mycobacteroides abscessus]CPS67926.1 Uncharacterised protein [Mycobacteroides abscessus]CPV16848.1 Uncharacterised protein [Mycobacteroides abscessus]SKP55125.1 Uncharacterised protein [Mycobacteroides abscessus subsp. abscessus]